MRQLAAAGLATLVLWALVALVGGGSVRSQPAEPAPAAGRVLFAPFLGARSAGEEPACWWPGGAGACPAGRDRRALTATEAARWGRSAGLVAQNGGTRPARFLAMYLTDVAGDDCPACRVAAVRCSPTIGPGETWSLPGVITATRATTAAVAAHAVVYSLSTQPAGEQGPAFTEYLAAQGLPADTPLAELACRAVDPGECPVYAAWHGAFVHGGPAPFAPELPLAPFRGEPVAGVAAAPIDVSGGTAPRLSLDRYAAATLDDVGVGAGRHVYYLPGAYLATEDGLQSYLLLQNAGLDCATIEVMAFETNQGQVEGPPHTVRLAVGGRLGVDLGRIWHVGAAATIRVVSDQPLAVALVNRGLATSSVSPALRERPGPVTWALPLAYQEARTNPQAAHTRPAGPVMAPHALPAAARPARLAADEGFGSYVSVFNPVSATRQVSIRTQAPGRPPRPEVQYPVNGLTQQVFQLGFGLGLPGGPGWGRFDAPGPPVYVALETWRSAADFQPAILEAWMTPAWAYTPDEAGPATVLLPDLGGPAVGATRIAQPRPGLGLTNTLTTQVAVQNLVTATARVALDSYAPCGYAGTIDRSIDPNQGLWLPTIELAGTPLDANAAVLRVLAGDVAVLAETTRPERATTTAYQPDFTNAYLGQGFAHTLPAPGVAITPTEITVRLADLGTEPPLVQVTPVNVDRVCHHLNVSADQPWLAGMAGDGSIPGEIAVIVTVDRLGPGQRHEGHLTVASDPPGATGLPATVTVTVIGSGRPAPLYLPYAIRARR